MEHINYNQATLSKYHFLQMFSLMNVSILDLAKGEGESRGMVPSPSDP